jgi:hypothetical protein
MKSRDKVKKIKKKKVKEMLKLKKKTENNSYWKKTTNKFDNQKSK